MLRVVLPVSTAHLKRRMSRISPISSVTFVREGYENPLNHNKAHARLKSSL